MSRGLRPTVHCEVFGSGDGLEIFWVVALQAGHKRHAHARSEKRIFTVGFLATSPSRIAKNIDVGRPDSESVVPDSGAIRMQIDVILGTKFGADDAGDAMH